jgi:hypothetical protein
MCEHFRKYWNNPVSLINAKRKNVINRISEDFGKSYLHFSQNVDVTCTECVGLKLQLPGEAALRITCCSGAYKSEATPAARDLNFSPRKTADVSIFRQSCRTGYAYNIMNLSCFSVHAKLKSELRSQSPIVYLYRSRDSIYLRLSNFFKIYIKIWIVNNLEQPIYPKKMFFVMPCKNVCILWYGHAVQKHPN